MTTYATTTTIRLPRSTGGRPLPAGHRFGNGSPEAEALGSSEVKRLISQGALRVLGLAPNLERETTRLELPRLPNDTEYGDAAGTKIEKVSAPKNLREEKVEVRPVGRQDMDPKGLRNLSVEKLNALVADVDPSISFEQGDEAEAIRYLSAEFRAAPNRKPGASGDAAPKQDDGPTRVVGRDRN